MALPDYRKALARVAKTPVLDETTGEQTGGVSWYNASFTQAPATVLAAGFFNFARETLRVNDHISVMCSAGGTGDKIEVIVTAVPATGNVTVAVNTSASGA